MKITMLTNQKGPRISKYIYGQFAEHLGRGIYGGLWVGEDSSIPNKNGIRTDVVNALKAINVPVVRWPGGCFADEYHWKDGVGEASKRKTIVNTNWGGVTETNRFGTHEYFELCSQLACDTYINGNVGSGTVQEMQEWVEYMTMPGESPMASWRRKNGREDPWQVTFLGIGNENWGCGGNMRPEYYADLYRRYQTFVRKYGEQRISKIACGANSGNYQWTRVLMERAAHFMDGISLHYYTVPSGEWHDKGNATGFTEDEWKTTIKRAKRMDELISRHAKIMDQYDPEKKVGMIVDEWGSWYNVEKGTNPGFLFQQNTIRDAMVAAVTLTIFHQHADRVRMANIAQMVNVLQAMLLTEGDQMVKTPTYYVFDLYKAHQDGELIGTYSDPSSDTISYTASKKGETLTLSICNYDLSRTEKIALTQVGNAYHPLQGEYIAAETRDAHNTFDHPNVVIKKKFTGYKMQENTVTVIAPPMSVITLTFGK
ncbi:alpha-N-arabinofuranosidase [Sporolactobacillus shoreicorticis]|uniref:non-reducing end alpha-L-arabinofuranosidase n=1 Tax=Sporolactobacillus shoreicorticis TaxID=1923877 RepID=A0ABW5S277_9BACL|nr:alpha-N-arabinofuranosidase [Sporolactobacillus shoreicorticis]MCO7124709.1 alpha-N-arabinofuranosidase [Sporolactobacillus shoreicorticis]